MIKQVESPQIQHSATGISSGRGQISYTVLDLVSRQRCARRARPENEEAARGQGAQDCERTRRSHRTKGWLEQSQ